MIVIPISSDIIFGIALLLIGSSFILKAIFNIDLPILRTMIGIILIIWGLSFFLDIKFKDKIVKDRRSKNFTVSINVDEQENNQS